MGFFSWASGNSASEELPNIFPFPYKQVDFVSIDVGNIYARILTDVLERTSGLTDEQKNLVWDNCVANEAQDGLITLLAKAMTDKAELYLIYDQALKLIRIATQAEKDKIKADYKEKGESDLGVYITFKNYRRTDMLKIYSALDYCAVSALDKSMNLSKAVQLKLSDLRGSTGLSDVADVKTQAVAIAKGLSEGKDVMLDSKDVLEMLKPDLTSTESAMTMNAQKMSLYLGLPASYITGQSKNSMGDTGEGDSRAIERGLKSYYFSIIKPVCEAIFGVKTTFKSEDFKQILSSLELLKTLELSSEELINMENKVGLINKFFGFPEGTKGGPKEKPAPPVIVNNVPGAKPPAAPPKPGA